MNAGSVQTDGPRPAWNGFLFVGPIGCVGSIPGVGQVLFCQRLFFCFCRVEVDMGAEGDENNNVKGHIRQWENQGNWGHRDHSYPFLDEPHQVPRVGAHSGPDK